MTIRDWLNSTDKSYHIGVSLYEKHGKSTLWKRIFTQGETRYNSQKLIELLSELLPVQKEPVAEPVSEVSPDVVSKILSELKNEWLPLYKQMNHLHSQLLHTTQKERGQMAFSILQLDEQIKSYWQKEKYVNTYKCLPSAAKSYTPHDLTTADGLLKRIKNLRTSISKQRNNPKRSADVEKWEAEKAELEEKLKSYES